MVCKTKKNEIWQQLQADQKAIEPVLMKDLFASDPERFKRFSLETAGLFLDYSKNRITSTILERLLKLTEIIQLPQQIESLFQGKIMNATTHQKVWHTLLRHPKLESEGPEALEVLRARQKMEAVVSQIRDQAWLGFSGKPVTDIVNIGIGGSDLGPRLVIDALRQYQKESLNFHFISNVDATHLSEMLGQLSPETTLFVLSSKSFGTAELLCHAKTIKHWLLSHSGNHPAVLEKHCLAVTANQAKAEQLGIPSHNILPLWDWVGGRFSVWSCIGLSAAIAMGMESFYRFLEGAYAMDQHFLSQPAARNMPIILALLSVWYINFWGVHVHAVIPYTDTLRCLPAYLQQLEMESNGKSVDQFGDFLEYATAPLVFGGVGTDVQHSFFQLLHQGKQWIPVDFIAVMKVNHPHESHHRLLLANCLAQGQALMQGYTVSQAPVSLSPHVTLEGNRPSNTLLMSELTPYTLGSLIALYEHKTIVEGFIWQVNSFDQWGVERGKKLAQDLLKAMENQHEASVLDVSTQGLLDRIKGNRLCLSDQAS